jgi:hypothetical protein
VEPLTSTPPATKALPNASPYHPQPNILIMLLS